ncbi:hypothetical protein K402DRAFT_391439 [Aulographum hederae CBS 113979]|uniref:Uncharacterized protein n=1 Tax=Aulographum hederae CBS 113979 TaxID=1176131 RepID=A0A6G1H677_9PEZI|nr:hypothetical protein K402DRAFT_391439 [Aulographum hederae CBS 113979]
MKTTTLVLSQAILALALPQAAPAPAPDADAILPLGPKVPNTIVPGGKAPETQELPSRFFPESKRIKIRYGPYQLPSIDDVGLGTILSGEKGTLSTMAVNMKKPCDGKCGLLSAQASLEYTNGTEANVDTGSWLHHVVQAATGEGKSDGVCGYPVERFFSSGNERTPTSFMDLMEKTIKSAYPVGPEDTFVAQIELMNMDSTPKEVY